MEKALLSCGNPLPLVLKIFHQSDLYNDLSPLEVWGFLIKDEQSMICCSLYIPQLLISKLITSSAWGHSLVRVERCTLPMCRHCFEDMWLRIKHLTDIYTLDMTSSGSSWNSPFITKRSFLDEGWKVQLFVNMSMNAKCKGRNYARLGLWQN